MISEFDRINLLLRGEARSNSDALDTFPGADPAIAPAHGTVSESVLNSTQHDSPNDTSQTTQPPLPPDAVIDLALRSLGVSQALTLLHDSWDPSTSSAPYNIVPSGDNTTWLDNSSLCEGDAVDLFAARRGNTRREAARELNDALQANENNENEWMLPETEAGMQPEFPVNCPLECLPKTLQDYAKASLHVDAGPAVIAAAAVISAASAALGAGIVVESLHDKHTYGNLYFLIGASSGSHKSSIAQRAFEPIYGFERKARQKLNQGRGKAKAHLDLMDIEIRGLLVEGKDETEEARERRLEKLAEAEAKKEGLLEAKTPPCLIVGDVTAPKLADLMSQNGGCDGEHRARCQGDCLRGGWTT